ncbi:MAG: signal peptidase I [Thermodesulfobacteriota bacterium]
MNDESRKNKEEKAPQGNRSALRENVEAVLVAVLLALLIRTFVVQAFKIPSGSMIPTLQIGDHILVSKFTYGLEIPLLRIPLFDGKDPARGDIIVFKYPEDPEKDFIKRVVAVGGDVVEIRNKQVYVNDAPLPDDYVIHTDPRMIPGRDSMDPLHVPPGKLFVMGDNRDNSHDSRFWKFVDMRAVRGKAFLIYWSWNNSPASVADRIRWGRLGHLIK